MRTTETRALLPSLTGEQLRTRAAYLDVAASRNREVPAGDAAISCPRAFEPPGIDQDSR